MRKKTSEDLKKDIEKMKVAMNINKDSSRSNPSQRTGQPWGSKEESEKELRTRQVIAFGFDGYTSAPTVAKDLEDKLKSLLGHDPEAIVRTTADPTKFGVIEFRSIRAKVDFWKRVRDELNKTNMHLDTYFSATP